MEEILIHVGSDSDDESSDEELEPDDDDLQCLQSAESVLSPSSPVKETCCSRQLQLEHTGSLSPTVCAASLMT